MDKDMQGGESDPDNTARTTIQLGDWSPRRLVRWVAGVGALLAAATTLIATSHGPGYSYSSQYVSAGVNLAQTGHLTTYSGEELTIFPPGMPAVIAIGELLGIGADLSIRLLNALMFALVVLLGCWLLWRHVRTPSIVIFGTIFFSVSLPLLLVAEMAWSEIWFISLCLGTLLSLEAIIGAPDHREWLYIGSLLSGIAFTIRYSAVALIVAGGISLLWALAERRGLRLAVRLCLQYGLLAMIIPVLVMVRNVAVAGQPMGPRPPGMEGIRSIMSDAITTFGSWLVPRPVPILGQQAVGLVLVVLLAGSAWCVVLRAVRARLDGNGPAKEVEPQGNASLVPIAMFVGLYPGYVIASAMATVLDSVANRLLVPVYVPLVVLLAVAVERAFLWSAGRSRISAAVVCSLVAVVLLQGAAFLREARGSALRGRAASSVSFRSSELVNEARRIPDGATVVTNRPDDLWAALRRPLERPASVEDLFGSTECEPIYFVWFDSDEVTDWPALPEAGIEVVFEADEGTLSQLTAASGCG